ncbi:MAG TPA: low temperature requirement protein A [Streptosporangiaceae bacterium]|nr:low temperature requirement protein A [Streptosporangiaceae bacterium]
MSTEGPDPASALDPDDAASTAGPLRVTTLELFFDLVFAFTLTQLTAILDTGLDLTAGGQVLLVFGLLWWMYEGYAWLTNARPPVHTAERVLLLAGMAGFLVVGLAIPDGFGNDGVTLGLGYLVVVLVHAFLYYRVNANIVRVAPFNVASALLVIAAGAAGGPARYLLWTAALVIQLGSPLIVNPRNLFGLRPAHMVERHSALLIVALGESVAAIGIGAATRDGHAAGTPAALTISSVLGLALAAALWWVLFGGSDEERTEQVLTAASSERRTHLALTALFYGNVPVLLGLVAMAAGVQETIAHAGGPAGWDLSHGELADAVVLAAGAAAFLAGDVAIRRVLRTGPVAFRAAGAVLALATIGMGVTVGLGAQLVLLTAVLVAMLLTEQHRDAPGPAQPGTAG